jgi:alpha-L-fucosidase
MTPARRRFQPLALLALGAAAGLAAAAAPASAGDPPYKPAPENLAAREWFQDARFGLFIHFGTYAVAEHGEWVMENEKIPITEYEKLPARFDPKNFDAAAIVATVKAAGMKYITITSKHHDGFAMWDSKVSDWNVVKRTPSRRTSSPSSRGSARSRA